MSPVNVLDMRGFGVSGAPRGSRVHGARRASLVSLETKAWLATEVIPDPVDLQVSRAALASEDRRDTEASEETGAKTERTG